MGVLAAQGRGDMVEVQVRRSVEAGELTLDEADEVILQLTHYVGWGLATSIAMIVPRLRRELAEPDAEARG
jgi:alkylhydroperoxidase/carboxymuconolactone decarboxylase family protein YurZ